MELYNIQLISAADVRAEFPDIPVTLHDDLFSGFIKSEGDTYLQGFLGKDMYQEFLLQYSTNTLTPTNDYLYERYIKVILCYRVKIKITLSSYIQYESSGMRIKLSDQSVSAEKEDVVFLSHIYENYCDNYAQDMVRYINENINDYPLFYKSTYCTCKDKSNYMNSRFGITGF